MNQKEIWKDVKNYEGHYQVSNLGNVKSLKCGREKILKPSLANTGYYRVCLTSGVVFIHKLVAISFLNHNPNGHQLVVDHIDNNPLNNKLENLQLISHRENCIKDRKSKYLTGVSKVSKSNKFRARIVINGKQKYLGCFTNELEASNAYQKELKKVNNNN